MKDIKGDLGIQSYCFRATKDHATVIERLKASGVSAIELCRAHVDFNDASRFEDVVRQYGEAGVRIVSIGVEAITEDVEKARKLCEFVKLAGARHISIDFKPDTSPASWRLAEKVADEYDIVLGIHNHGGRHWLGSKQILHHVLSNTNERIGLCLDTAWAEDSGEDPIAFAEEFADKLYGVHIKDFVFDRARKQSDVIVGEGNLDLPRLLELIRENDKTDMVVLEYEGDVENPVPALAQCVEKVTQLA